MASINHRIAGTVRFEALSGGRIRLLDDWEARNIVTVHIPELKGVPTYGAPFSGNVRWHRLSVPQLQAAFAEVGRLGLQKDILFWDGSFVPRMKRGSTTSPSEHTFGNAFDINATWNPFRRKPAAPGAKGNVWRLVPIFEKYGFECGAKWKNTPDGMHFQVRQLLSPAQLDAMSSVTPLIQPGVQPAPAFFLNDHKLEGAHLIGGKLMVPIREVTEALNHQIQEDRQHSTPNAKYLRAWLRQDKS